LEWNVPFGVELSGAAVLADGAGEFAALAGLPISHAVPAAPPATPTPTSNAVTAAFLIRIVVGLLANADPHIGDDV
jgi:hypothetical protein